MRCRFRDGKACSRGSGARSSRATPGCCCSGAGAGTRRARPPRRRAALQDERQVLQRLLFPRDHDDGANRPGSGPLHAAGERLDFVWSGVEHLSFATSKRELKYALLHFVSGMELILTERLRREDWKLLSPKPDQVLRPRARPASPAKRSNVGASISGRGLRMSRSTPAAA